MYNNENEIWHEVYWKGRRGKNYIGNLVLTTELKTYIGHRRE